MFSVTGMPWSRSTALKTSLSMQSAEREHARADVRHAGELEQALHRPVLAERSVQHREDDVDVARASSRPPCPAGAREAPGARLSRAASGRRGRPRSRAPRHRRLERPHDARADAIEIGFSLDRPPRITAMRRVTVWWSSLPFVLLSAALLELADVDDHDLARLRVGAGSRVGGLDDAVLRRIGDRIGDDRRGRALLP